MSFKLTQTKPTRLFLETQIKPTRNPNKTHSVIFGNRMATEWEPICKEKFATGLFFETEWVPTWGAKNNRLWLMVNGYWLFLTKHKDYLITKGVSL